MNATGSWRVLSTGDQDDVVLVCDFPTSIRPEATFADLAASLRPVRTVWEAVPPPPGAERGWTAADYLRTWLTDLRDAEVTVGAVLGFCAGGVFAGAIAERIAGWQDRAPELVLFDPERPTGGALYAQYHRGAELFGAVLSADEVADLLRRGQELLRANDDVQVFGPALSELYVSAGDTAFERVGLDPVRRAELSATFTSFVNWVVAADQLDPTAAWARATAISSATRGSGTDLAGRERAFDVAHVDLLRDAAVADAVSGLLSSVPKG
jgi:hypothetical protein